MLVEHTIWPLSFLQIYQSTNPFIDALEEHDVTVQEWSAGVPVLKRIAATTAIPLYYHLMTSGYGAFEQNSVAGWIYLRGWRQVLYVEGLAVMPAHRRQGIGRQLLRFAEDQGRQLRREWLGLTVTVGNTAAVNLYEQMGYQRGHSRLLCSAGSFQPIPSGGASLRSLLPPEANTVFHALAERDMIDHDAETGEVLSRFLGRERYRSAFGKQWLVTANGKNIGYLNRYKKAKRVIVYAAAPKHMWGSAEMVGAIGQALSDVPGGTSVDIRLASAGHHDVMRDRLADYGFAEEPSATMKMFKHLK